MNKATNTVGLLAGIIFLLGIILSTIAILHYPASKQQHAKDLRISAKLNKLELKFSELDKQIAPLAQLDYANLPDAQKIIENLLGEENIEDFEQNREALGNGYTLNKINLTSKNIDLEKLPNFIRTIESLRPPIKVTSCNITASKMQQGYGTVILELERVER